MLISPFPSSAVEISLFPIVYLDFGTRQSDLYVNISVTFQGRLKYFFFQSFDLVTYFTMEILCRHKKRRRRWYLILNVKEMSLLGEHASRYK